MADYAYKCNKCGNVVSASLSIHAEIPQSLGPCPIEKLVKGTKDVEPCGGEMKRYITGGSGFSFKGGSPTK